jgi:hypothetical protein
MSVVVALLIISSCVFGSIGLMGWLPGVQVHGGGPWQSLIVLAFAFLFAYAWLLRGGTDYAEEETRMVNMFCLMLHAEGSDGHKVTAEQVLGAVGARPHLPGESSAGDRGHSPGGSSDAD